jgi:hypothetical protein
MSLPWDDSPGNALRWRWLPGDEAPGVLVASSVQRRIVGCGDRQFSLHLCVGYAPVYRTPVLFIRADDSASGVPLPLRQLAAELGQPAADVLLSSSVFSPTGWPNESPHPQLRDGGAWLALHPCQTRDVLHLLLVGTDDHQTKTRLLHRRYMRAWWSLVSGIIGFALPLEHQAVS